MYAQATRYSDDREIVEFGRQIKTRVEIVQRFG